MALDGLTRSAVHLSLPDLSLFKFPPPNEPVTLPPQDNVFSLERPFNINPDLYTELLSVKYPLTIAAVYATTVTFLNGFNARRKNKPWRVSKTRPFFWAVIAHNVFLAVYSAWTCWSMFFALKRTIPHPSEGGLVGVVDAMCKMQGPRGLSSAISYDPVAQVWSAPHRAVQLLQGKPDPSDVGRLWNEGLAFLGWLFYLSKFYEVIDTLIILAKGKKSSLLQTYHHAGAMLCMWAGVRYMSPPIWMFVLVNSGIHALMYSYYTVSALGIRVPQAFKRTLTTLQITQFLIGAAYALIHLFVSYDLPVEKPYLFVQNVSSALPSITSSIAATATAAAGDWLKKLVLRAAGEEGAAENVLNQQGEAFGQDALNAMDVAQTKEEIRYKWETATTACVDTPGQVFGIYLNVMYLAPLTYLFVMFFIRSYLKKASKRRPSFHDVQDNIRTSSYDAAGKVNRAVIRAMSGKQGSYSDFEFAKGDSDIDLQALAANGKQDLKDMGNDAREQTNTAIKQTRETTKETMTKSQILAKDIAEATQDNLSSGAKKAKETAPQVAGKSKEQVQAMTKEAKKAADKIASSISEERNKTSPAAAASAAVSKAKENVAPVKDKVDNALSQKSAEAIKPEPKESAKPKETAKPKSGDEPQAKAQQPRQSDKSQPASYAAAAAKEIPAKAKKPSIPSKGLDDETEEERNARELVERAYAAAKQD